jgi:hypothetical protein
MNLCDITHLQLLDLLQAQLQALQSLAMQFGGFLEVHLIVYIRLKQNTFIAFLNKLLDGW